ncbi:cysteine--tRNA ligase [Candidatus Dependentiae bacterium]|nr:cysteine--tRNA ligase [Candidatus Dependentiae bacterium]
MKKTINVPFLMLFNTLTNQQEKFSVPRNSVSLYACGITPYDYAHLGHGRCYVTFDVLYRLLNFLGYTVTYCRNFTDIDDKLIRRAEKEYNDPEQYILVAQRFIESFHEDMKALGCLTPDFEPRVTTHIPHIITFIEGLVAAGKAYVTPLGDVYYSIESFSDYGKLSKRTPDELKAGARISVRGDKRNPADFALWKASDNPPGWESPWGFGRPGWHIECSAMSKEYLGETLDIHAGGMDLIFPHHENEIAQSEGLHTKPFARYWVHNAFVRLNEEKMSKSLGNFFTLRDVYEKYSPMVIRYYYVTHHYRNPLDFKDEDLQGAVKSYQRLCRLFEKIIPASVEELRTTTSPLVESLIAALCDDLNGAKFFGILFDHVTNQGLNEESLVKGILVHVLGLTMEPYAKSEVVITPQIERLLEEREEARKAKEWKRADEIRDELRLLGVELQDKKLD